MYLQLILIAAKIPHFIVYSKNDGKKNRKHAKNNGIKAYIFFNTLSFFSTEAQGHRVI